MSVNVFDPRAVADRLQVTLDGVACQVLRIEGRLYAERLDVTTLGSASLEYVEAPTLLRMTVEVRIADLPAGTRQDVAALLAAPGARAIKVRDE